MIKKKICLVGAFAVGKTSLVRQYVYSIFSEKYQTTVGVKVDKKTVAINDRQVDLIIWDLHGEDEFQTVRMSYLRGAAGCIYVVDGTRGATLDTALGLKTRVAQTIGDVPAIVALNKQDLEPEWEINTHDVEGLMDNKIPVIKTSAKSGYAVENTFGTLARLILESR